MNRLASAAPLVFALLATQGAHAQQVVDLNFQGLSFNNSAFNDTTATAGNTFRYRNILTNTSVLQGTGLSQLDAIVRVVQQHHLRRVSP